MTPDPTTPTHDDQPWAPCPAGALASMAKSLAAQQRRRRMLRVAVTASAGAGVVACVALLAALLLGLGKHGGIYCPECRSHFTAYAESLDGQTPREQVELSDEMLESMRIHLAECKQCRQKFQAAYPSALVARANHGMALQVATWQPTFSIAKRRQTL